MSSTLCEVLVWEDVSESMLLKNLIANRPTKKIKTMLRKISRKSIKPNEWAFDWLEDVLDESEVLSVAFGEGGVFSFSGEEC